MHKISTLISNIHKYGNCKVYLLSGKPITNRVIDFSVDAYGCLHITVKLEYFDKPFWNGVKTDDSANMKSSVKLASYSESNFNIPIATVVYCSFYKGKTMITHQEKSTKVNTDTAVDKIYQIVNPMLKLSNKDLTQWVLYGENGIKNMMIQKSSQNSDIEEINPTRASDTIEEEMQKVQDRLSDIYKVWKNLQNSSVGEEYNRACREWELLHTDSEISTENHFQKRIK